MEWLERLREWWNRRREGNAGGDVGVSADAGWPWSNPGNGDNATGAWSGSSNDGGATSGGDGGGGK